MACITEQELSYFNQYCKNRGIENNFYNYMVWKERMKQSKGVLKY